MRIAINQPYFIPYTGFFRLLASTDLFVVMDCVQHIRRGYIHRNKLLTAQGSAAWLTLPLKKCPQDTKIKDLEFRGHWSKEQLIKFPALLKDDSLVESLLKLWGSPCDYIVNMLRLVCEELDIPFNIIYSSSLNIHPSLKGEDRILEICERVGATEYVNAPGGRALYDVRTFAKRGISLKFLSEWEGSKLSILQRLLTEDRDEIRSEIYAQL